MYDKTKYCERKDSLLHKELITLFYLLDTNNKKLWYNRNIILTVTKANNISMVDFTFTILNSTIIDIGPMECV